MLILVSNDDGIQAPGLKPLVSALSTLGEVVVVAPDRERSATSHAFTMHDPLRVEERSPGWISVSGTPADCVYLALNHLLDRRPGLVVSGINRGANLATDVIYSGTVAAAMEARMAGVPSMAVSLSIRRGQPQNWDTAAALAAGLAKDLLASGELRLLNLNVPDRPASEVLGLRACPLSRRHYHPSAEERYDPRGRSYFWLGGGHSHFEGAVDTDGPLVGEGWATVTPLHYDWTEHEAVQGLRDWDSVDSGPGDPDPGR